MRLVWLLGLVVLLLAFRLLFQWVGGGRISRRRSLDEVEFENSAPYAQVEIGEELPALCIVCGNPASRWKANSFAAESESDRTVEMAGAVGRWFAGGLIAGAVNDAQVRNYMISVPLCGDHAINRGSLSPIRAIPRGPREMVLVGVAPEFATAVRLRRNEQVHGIAATMRFLDDAGS